VTPAISLDLRQRVFLRAGNRCEYCLAHQDHVFDILEIDHIIPTAFGGTDDEGNLCASCGLCNRYKGAQHRGSDPQSGEIVDLFNPRGEGWYDHFAWEEQGVYIVGLTACGRATVQALQLNNAIAVTVRRHWVEAGWYPPTLGPAASAAATT
jgi:Zn ribbon nucleic-acid-binding protein